MLRVDFDHVRWEHDVDAVVRALAHPVRRAIVEALARTLVPYDIEGIRGARR